MAVPSEARGAGGGKGLARPARGGSPPTQIRVRMAPSPTGFVHLGSARTALFDYLFARRQAGVFVLRVEDTDEARNQPHFETAFYEGLHWLGLRWEEGPDVGGAYGPYRQSERMDLYREAAASLLKAGAAYRCYCTKEELDAEREAARAAGRPYKYSRRCLTNPPVGRDQFTVRFQVPAGDGQLPGAAGLECGDRAGDLYAGGAGRGLRHRARAALVGHVRLAEAGLAQRPLHPPAFSRGAGRAAGALSARAAAGPRAPRGARAPGTSPPAGRCSRAARVPLGRSSAARPAGRRPRQAARV